MKKTMRRNTKIVLGACPRCHGDLFPDEYEEDFACLQCGRRFGVAAVREIMAAREGGREFVQAA